MSGEADHVRRNREAWDHLSEEYAEPGRRAWARDVPTWGVWHIPEFRAHGFVVEDLIEIRAPEGGSPGRHTFVTLEWARRWPSEEIWRVRKAQQQ